MHAFSVMVDLVFAHRLMEVNCVFYMLVNINRMQARPTMLCIRLVIIIIIIIIIIHIIMLPLLIVSEH